jgi:hypothetical protein
MHLISRIEAKAQGLKRYFTGKPCKRGHVAERYVSTPTCVVCCIDDSRKRRTVSPDKARAAGRAWHARNPQLSAAIRAAGAATRRGLDADVGYLAELPCPAMCPVLNTPIKFGDGTGRRPPENTASFDRIDSTKGYVRGNVQVISKKANAMKLNATEEELKLFARWVLKH